MEPLEGTLTWEGRTFREVTLGLRPGLKDDSSFSEEDRKMSDPKIRYINYVNISTM